MGIIRLWTGFGEKDFGELECGKCYQMSGNVSTLNTNPSSVRFGIIDWALYFSGGVNSLQALADFYEIFTVDITATGNYVKTFDMECFQFGSQQLPPNAILWTDADIELTIDELILTEACQTEMCSECFFLQDNPKGILVEVENDRDAFGLKYEGVGKGDAQFKQQMLIPGVLEPIDYPYPVEETHKYGDGHKLPIKTDSEETYEMVTKMLPDYMHDALRLFLKHRVLRLNGDPFFKIEGTYTPEIDRERNLASQVAVDVQKLPQNKFDGYC